MAQRRGKFSFRNLTKSQLGGVVFGCTKNTIKECMSKQLFGLPSNHYPYVQKIDIGLPLFLFNYSDRTLHGIFEAAGCGQLNFDPYGWTSDGSERTSYPAQVPISVRLQCEPLSEEKFKPAIADNYYSSHHFWFELDHFQTRKLTCLLTSFAVKPKPPMNTPNTRQIFRLISSSEKKENSDEVKPSENEPVGSLEVSLSSGGESDSSAAASHPGFSENHPDVQNPKQIDKDHVLEKLKDLVFSHDEHGDNSLTETVEQANIPTCKNLEDRDTLEEETCSEGKIDGSCLVSSPLPHTISQLMHEVKELRACGLENSTKICYLEEKLDKAHKEIYQLTERCNMLESISGPLITKAGGSDLEIHSPDDTSLDPTEAILLLGGFDKDSETWLSSVQSYFPSRNVVKAHSSMSCIRSNASVAKLDGKIYVFGGDDGGRGWTNSAESFNQTDGQWSLCPPLNERKGSLGGATLDGKIFAIGGGNGMVSFSDVEMLDPDIGRWIRTRSMGQERFAVASVEHKSSIYAVGGYDGKEYLNTAERFDPREHSWMNIASMKSRRGCHSLVVLNEKLYAIGGFDGETMVSSVEIYEPRTGTWMTGEPMKDLRGYSAVAVVKDSIYVIGGYKGEEDDILDTVECFKEGEGWKNVPSSSIGRRCFLSAVAL
ncbi:Kelch repeat type 1 [Arabidopsis suecica]|uniref:Influenza virus NS1A-binding protein n=2 Tax=Arabidopsis TaxID=3701 RepID=F4K9G6_ARATH|nr:influenza virus NS1A-binding protein [Arabidopsis thaliana]NP_195786.4 influenza virus NS1A-binding protein [Arabidopsis thaliana]AED90373.1 influenza virus NS1A-binding protein [Arabidopsis thaliana]ANM69769.1 influenza virus NS1A-binding protein [Arabidopsis thaliana]KAG7607751.1 Kelch repeat type 1 [Arabidopsis suecica]|eukprot:NP_001331423.1 influenza virus NS1A-binding protein [Arabidopsis thaliana]